MKNRSEAVNMKVGLGVLFACTLLANVANAQSVAYDSDCDDSAIISTNETSVHTQIQGLAFYDDDSNEC